MKIGLIGHGYWGGGFVARNIARVAELALVVDQDPAKQAQAAETWGVWGTDISSEPERAFQECDAVWIATPAHTHYDMVKGALSAGRHVLCEKPFVMSYDQACELTELAVAQGVALMVGHLSLFTEQHRLAKELVTSDDQRTQWLSYVRHTDRPSLSDISVLWGLGPHDVASAVDLFGGIKDGAATGNQHRVFLELMLERGKVTIDLDWLSAERTRSMRMDGKPVVACDSEEPLLREARSFLWLCRDQSGPGRARCREIARQVTAVLDAAELNLSVPAATAEHDSFGLVL